MLNASPSASRGTPGHPFENGFDLTLRADRLSRPLSWKRPRMIFVNSMSDLFHKDIPTEFINRVFDTMEQAHWHVFQILTKRSSLMRNYLRYRYRSSLTPQHIWCGVSVEDSATTGRIQTSSRSTDLDSLPFDRTTSRSYRKHKRRRDLLDHRWRREWPESPTYGVGLGP